MVLLNSRFAAVPALASLSGEEAMQENIRLLLHRFRVHAITQGLA